MKITQIVQNVNDLLAGELLTYDALKVHLDATIDDINAALSSGFPSFTEFIAADYVNYPDYNFFPDRYIRSVVCLGAAYKFFITDEEGIVTAQKYGYSYDDNLFYMLRDYIDQVPEAYQIDAGGTITTPALFSGF